MILEVVILSSPCFWTDNRWLCCAECYNNFQQPQCSATFLGVFVDPPTGRDTLTRSRIAHFRSSSSSFSASRTTSSTNSSSSAGSPVRSHLPRVLAAKAQRPQLLDASTRVRPALWARSGNSTDRGRWKFSPSSAAYPQTTPRRLRDHLLTRELLRSIGRHRLLVGTRLTLQCRRSRLWLQRIWVVKSSSDWWRDNRKGSGASDCLVKAATQQDSIMGFQFGFLPNRLQCFNLWSSGDGAAVPNRFNQLSVLVQHNFKDKIQRRSFFKSLTNRSSKMSLLHRAQYWRWDHSHSACSYSLRKVLATQWQGPCMVSRNQSPQA